MEELAERVLERIKEDIGHEPLVGVSYFTGEEVDHVYQSEWARETFEREQVDQIVRDLQLEALGYGAYERTQESQLHATVRVYEEMLDVVVPVNDREGVAVALELADGYTTREVVTLVEEAIAKSQAVEREPVYHE
ncbi:hypothetical protein GCM10027435_16110 [Haloparvum alkalitolerans]|uniref:hypothetical protein n=1 Tax=Haloparvum alkalitolerans TaxID=1042953 RepID=UPI003CF2097E